MSGVGEPDLRNVALHVARLLFRWSPLRYRSLLLPLLPPSRCMQMQLSQSVAKNIGSQQLRARRNLMLAQVHTKAASGACMWSCQMGTPTNRRP